MNANANVNSNTNVNKNMAMSQLQPFMNMTRTVSPIYNANGQVQP